VEYLSLLPPPTSLEDPLRVKENEQFFDQQQHLLIWPEAAAAVTAAAA
jgi:hypothetical protein